jgi:hypothetical protein
MYAAAMTLMLIAAGAPAGNDTDYTDIDSFSDSAGDSGHLGGGMPQTCYAPRYGCYPGNGRCTHRYPAFHGQYYRRPYNYRNLFDYPWHAQLHEPTSMFSYHVPPPEEVRRGTTDEAPRPPRDSETDNARSIMKRPRVVRVAAPDPASADFGGTSRR